MLAVEPCKTSARRHFLRVRLKRKTYRLSSPHPVRGRLRLRGVRDRQRLRFRGVRDRSLAAATVILPCAVAAWNAIEQRQMAAL